MPATTQGLPAYFFRRPLPLSVIASYDDSGRGHAVQEMFDMASTLLGDEITLDGRDDNVPELCLEGVTAPANPNDGTRTNSFQLCWDIPEQPPGRP
jgi:hypothetical protein